MSEPKETESGTEAQAEGLSEPREADASSDEAETSSDAKEAAADEATEAAAESPEAAQAAETPKKKKKKARAEEPETIKDRNARVRAEAAEKRRSKREREQGGSPKRNLDASEVMDDALARSTHAAAGFLTKHFNKVQWVIMAGLAGWIGYEVYDWRHDKNVQKNTDAIFTALSAEMGKVGDSGAADAESGLPEDGRRTFATDEERLKAAKSAYVLASTSTGSAIADLGVAGAAYDLGQYKEAQAAYEKVQKSALYAKDNDVKGRTLEGLAMTLEAQKSDDAALKTFKELANMDSANFAALGMYHQARILKTQGKNEDALKLVEKAGEKLTTLKETPAVIRYVGRNVLELLESMDATKAKALSEKLMSTEAKKQQEAAAKMPAGMQNLSPDMQRKLQEMMEKMQKEAPPAPAGEAPMPGPVMPGPVEDAPAPASSGAP